MELKVDIEFSELLSAGKQLPENQLAILKEAISKKKEGSIKNEAFKAFLLKGPVMTDEHYKEFQGTRKQINQWRAK